jgi:hypothetical protein
MVVAMAAAPTAAVAANAAPPIKTPYALRHLREKRDRDCAFPIFKAGLLGSGRVADVLPREAGVLDGAE